MEQDRCSTGEADVGPEGRRRPRSPRLLWIVALAALALAALASSTAAVSLPTVRPAHGKPFHPRLGDWEGNAGGFPVSFRVKLTAARAGARYALKPVVALIPAGCPTVSYRHTEAVISSKRGALVGAHGQLGLARVGFTGSFTGPGSAILSSPPGGPGCGRLTWTLHPAKRSPVGSGRWRLSFANGESSRFSVIGDGRLVTGVQLPQALTRCNGASGAIDLFIGASGRAVTAQPHVRASIRFGLTTATGQLNAGGKGCRSGALSFTAHRL